MKLYEISILGFCGWVTLLSLAVGFKYDFSTDIPLIWLKPISLFTYSSFILIAYSILKFKHLLCKLDLRWVLIGLSFLFLVSFYEVICTFGTWMALYSADTSVNIDHVVWQTPDINPKTGELYPSSNLNLLSKLWVEIFTLDLFTFLILFRDIKIELSS